MKLFVWDFHGVLEEGTEIVVHKVSNMALKKLGYKERFSRKEIDHLYGLKWYEYFEYLLPNHNFDKLLTIQKVCLDISKQSRVELNRKHLKSNVHAHTVLEKTGKHNEQILVSNSQSEAIEWFVKQTSLDKYFKDRIFGVNVHDKKSSKKKALSNYLIKSGNHYDKIVTIGDSAQDMEIYDGKNYTRYLYTHPYKKHKKAPFDYKINDLREILKEL